MSPLCSEGLGYNAGVLSTEPLKPHAAPALITATGATQYTGQAIAAWRRSVGVAGVPANPRRAQPLSTPAGPGVERHLDHAAAASTDAVPGVARIQVGSFPARLTCRRSDRAWCAGQPPPQTRQPSGLLASKSCGAVLAQSPSRRSG
jgi:hypothetical protein